MNIMINFVPNDTILINDKDLSWINSKIIKLIQEKFCDTDRLSKKLANDKLKSKCYWTILKIFIIGKRITCIPPLIQYNKYLSDFQLKSVSLTCTFSVNVH